MSDKLRDELIRVAFESPETREDLLPLVTQKVGASNFIDLDDGRRRTDREVITLVAELVSWQYAMKREKKIFVQDNGGRFTEAAAKKAGHQSRVHALRSIGEDRIWEESGYAMEGEDWKGSKKLKLLASLLGKANIRIDPITSPRSGNRGWRITL